MEYRSYIWARRAIGRGVEELDVIAVAFWVGASVLVGQALFALVFFLAAIREGERRAALLGGLQFAGMLCVAAAYLYGATTGLFETRTGAWVLLLVFVYGLLAYAALVMRWGRDKRAAEGTRGYIVGEVARFDQRETVFSREQLQPGTEEYKAFYAENGEYEARDAERRKLRNFEGGPGSMDVPHEKPNRAAMAAQSLFSYLVSTPNRITPKGFIDLEGAKPVSDAAAATARVKGFARQNGAALVGVTEIDANWVYSHRGGASRQDGEEWGQEISLGHRYAVVFATEMDVEMVGTAPHTASMVETMRNYAWGSIISTMTASYIANLGHSATAQHLSHYDVLLVPLAVDAGLGELGRHGYLITKDFGPRVRLAAVTTDMPMIPDKPVDIGVRDFCAVCKKCAACCPSKSIPMGAAAPYNGTLRWKLDADTCHEFWGKIGSDCNICMRVCPWSHPGTLPHRLITESVSRNKISRRIFTLMDDVFYGRNPAFKEAPRWAHFGEWDGRE